MLLLGVVTAYAVYHPLAGRWWSNGEPPALKPSRADYHQHNPIIENRGGRPVRIVAIEPGVEHGFALHFAGIGFQRPMWSPNEPSTIPFHPFTLAPHATRDDLVMTISRAGCRPGATGRIDSIRVRYDLGGARSKLLRLAEPLTLSC